MFCEWVVEPRCVRAELALQHVLQYAGAGRTVLPLFYAWQVTAADSILLLVVM
jgi:hypothetical protein